MRTVLVIGIALLFIAILVIEFGYTAICDGSYDLSVTVKSASSAPIAAVSCEGFSRVENAESRLADIAPPETRLWSASAEPFTGVPLLVVIPLSFRESPLGRTWGDTQFHGLLVIVQYKDGQRIGKAVEIPHRRETRSLTVEVP